MRLAIAWLPLLVLCAGSGAAFVPGGGSARPNCAVGLAQACRGRPRAIFPAPCVLHMSSSAPASGGSRNYTHSTMQVTGKGATWDDFRQDTRIVKGGYHGDEWTTDPLGRSVVNPPVYHASTVTFPSVAALREARKDHPFMGMSYGRHGNPTTYALEEAFAVMEGADNACAVASGVAAINAALLAFVKSGDHIVVSDGVYDPTRTFCDKFLAKFNVACTYFDPTCTPAELAELFTPDTKVLFMESPSSLSFELHDFAALARVAKERGATVIADNTYGPTLLRPLELGADVSLNAATKYIGGHSDAMMGLIGCSRETYRAVKRSVQTLGCPPGPDDCYLCLRGMRTLSVRMRRHEESAVKVARWLQARDDVVQVMHPALESHPQHDIFRRDFAGSSGLFSFQLQDTVCEAGVDALCDNLRLFAMGYSWGGFESLILPCNISAVRSVRKWQYGDGYGATLRLHIGLEDVEDLIADLAHGLAVMHQVNGS